jgi:hypothetical protein
MSPPHLNFVRSRLSGNRRPRVSLHPDLHSIRCSLRITYCSFCKGGYYCNDIVTSSLVLFGMPRSMMSTIFLHGSSKVSVIARIGLFGLTPINRPLIRADSQPSSLTVRALLSWSTAKEGEKMNLEHKLAHRQLSIVEL